MVSQQTRARFGTAYATLIEAALPTFTLKNTVDMVSNGHRPADLEMDTIAYAGDINPYANSNPNPEESVYPKSDEDSPYSISEEELCAAIYILDT
ncbi:hypothetical protein YB2330_002345, partial [Saitoella coloradoensis]